MAELSTGVRTLLARMESNPEEFYGDADKWRFIFAPNFREVMTEPEKGALHEALAEVRRKEFDERVIQNARGNEETLMAEMGNVKREVIELGKDLIGAKDLAGKLPEIERLLTKAAKNVDQDAQARKNWRKYSPVMTAVFAAIITSLAQRFGLPPAASNDPHALLPGATPTVSVK